MRYSTFTSVYKVWEIQRVLYTHGFRLVPSECSMVTGAAWYLSLG